MELNKIIELHNILVDIKRPLRKLLNQHAGITTNGNYTEVQISGFPFGAVKNGTLEHLLTIDGAKLSTKEFCAYEYPAMLRVTIGSIVYFSLIHTSEMKDAKIFCLKHGTDFPFIIYAQTQVD